MACENIYQLNQNNCVNLLEHTRTIDSDSIFRGLWDILELTKKQRYNNAALQMQKAVSAHFTSKQILPFAFARQNGWLLNMSSYNYTHCTDTIDLLLIAGSMTVQCRQTLERHWTGVERTRTGLLDAHHASTRSGSDPATPGPPSCQPARPIRGWCRGTLSRPGSSPHSVTRQRIFLGRYKIWTGPVLFIFSGWYNTSSAWFSR